MRPEATGTASARPESAPAVLPALSAGRFSATEWATSLTHPKASRSRRPSLLAIAALGIGVLALAAAAWFARGKRPLISDTAKLCRIHELSGCVQEPSEFSFCELDWLRRRLWSMGVLDDLISSGGPAGVRGLAKVLRQRATGQGLTVCPTADRWDLLGDVEQFCEPSGKSAELDRCLFTEADGTACQRIDVRTSAGRAVRDHLVATTDANRRSSIVRDFVAPNGVLHRCSASVELDARQASREAAHEATEEKARWKPTVRIEMPAVDGGLDPGVVIKAAKARLPEIQTCYEPVRRGGTDASGRIVFHFLAPAHGGRVRKVEIEQDTVGNQAIADCATRAVRRIDAPAAAEATEVSLPLLFQ